MSPTFRSLRVPNYRLWASGAIVSNTGTWMQRVAQDWLVLTVLTHNSGLAVGITTGLQFGPMLLLAPVAGAMADRVSRRKLLIATQTLFGLLALALGLLVVLDLARLWEVYLLALLLGVVAAVDSPTRQAFVSELVPARDLPNAVGLNSASFHAGRLIGPGIAGLLIRWLGTGPVFLINAATFGAVLLSLTRMDVSQLRPVGSRPGRRGSLREGVAYVRHRPDILLILVVIAVIGTFGMNFQLTTALMARLVFHRGSGEYGLLGSIMAIGSLAGALLAARRERPGIPLVLGASAAFGVFALIAALMPSYQWFAVALIPVGLSSLTLMTAANSAVQITTPAHMRGRVMALYLAVFMGGTPIGSPLIGWVGQQFGARWTILAGSVTALPTALLGALWLARIKARGQLPGRVAELAPAAARPGLDTDGAERAAARSAGAERAATRSAGAERATARPDRPEPIGGPEAGSEAVARHRVPVARPAPGRGCGSDPVADRSV